MASGLTAPTALGTRTAGTASNPIVLTTTAGVPAGDAIAVFICNSGVTVTINSVTDSAGNTYTATANSPATGTTRRSWIYVCNLATYLPVASSISVDFSTITGNKGI